MDFMQSQFCLSCIIHVINVAVLQQLCVHVYIVLLLLYLHFTLGQLYESDLDTLVEEMSSVSTKWESIGRKLFVPPDHQHLTDIRTSYSTSHDCMREMLRYWLHDLGYIHTWGHIIRALRSTGEPQLADTLKAKYIPGELTITPSSQYSLECQHGENEMM